MSKEWFDITVRPAAPPEVLEAAVGPLELSWSFDKRSGISVLLSREDAEALLNDLAKALDRKVLEA